MAEFVMRDLIKKRGLEDKITAEPAATSTEELGNDVHPGTKSKLKKMGIPYFKRQARRINIDDYRKFDLIIGMDSYNIRNIMRIVREDPENKVKLLLDFTDRPKDIADPWYTGNFDETYNDILEGCEALLDKINP